MNVDTTMAKRILTSSDIVAMQEAIARLEAENQALKSAKPSGGLKISAKGGLSFYGLGRFPVTLYKSQWLKLIANVEQIKAFMAANDSLLAEKAE